jgi:hypothetical protein
VSTKNKEFATAAFFYVVIRFGFSNFAADCGVLNGAQIAREFHKTRTFMRATNPRNYLAVRTLTFKEILP